MHPLFREPVTAVEVMREWLEKRGFTLQEADPSRAYRDLGEGYFVRHFDAEVYDGKRRAAIGYRGGGRSGSRAKLREVAEMFDGLGAEYDVEENERHFLKLVVTLSDALDGKLDDAPPTEAAG